MKCEKCGASIEIENNFCPYCGAENLYYRQHRQEMASMKEDYEKIKDHVMEKHRKIAGFSVKIAVICILIAVDLLLIFLAANMWSFLNIYEEIQAKKNHVLYRQRLEEYEKERDYMGLVAFYDEKNIYGVEELEDFDAVYRACSSYRYIYGYLVDLQNEESYLSGEEKIKYICDNLDYLYEACEQQEYEKEEQFQGEHKKLMDRLQYDLEALFITYGGITKEEAQQFSELSYGRRQIALERGIGSYED